MNIVHVGGKWNEYEHHIEGSDFSFSGYVRYLFECVQKGVGEYPDYFAPIQSALRIRKKGKQNALCSVISRI